MQSPSRKISSSASVPSAAMFWMRGLQKPSSGCQTWWIANGSDGCEPLGELAGGRHRAVVGEHDVEVRIGLRGERGEQQLELLRAGCRRRRHRGGRSPRRLHRRPRRKPGTRSLPGVRARPRLLFLAACPRGCSARGRVSTWPPMAVPILMYHAVLPIDAAAKVRGTVPLAVFRDQIGWLARRGYRALTLDDVADASTAPAMRAARAVAITFDDGYRCVLEHAFPVLAEFGMTATLFVVTGAVGTDDGLVRRRRRSRLRARGLGRARARGGAGLRDRLAHRFAPRARRRRATRRSRTSSARAARSIAKRVGACVTSRIRSARTATRRSPRCSAPATAPRARPRPASTAAASRCCGCGGRR